MQFDDRWGVPTAETIAALQRMSEAKPPRRRYVVVIIHYENPGEIRELIASIQSWSEQPEEVVVADNSAPKYDLSDLALPGIPVRVVPSPGNPGYGQAANLGIVEVDAKVAYVLLLTQDTRLETNTASALLDTIRSDRLAAVAGPALVYRSKPDRYFSLGGRLSRRGETSHDSLGAPLSSIPSTALKTKAVDWVDGACLMLRTDIFRSLNGFDPAYFLYVEEVDYQFRVRLTGHRILINQAARAAQEPGAYLWKLKRRSHIKFTTKFRSSFARWPSLRHALTHLGRFLLKVTFSTKKIT